MTSDQLIQKMNEHLKDYEFDGTAYTYTVFYTVKYSDLDGDSWQEKMNSIMHFFNKMHEDNSNWLLEEVIPPNSFPFTVEYDIVNKESYFEFEVLKK